jgi:guanylate kinase
MNNRQEPQTTARGHLFVVSAPSGGGKSTLCAEALSRCPDLRYSVSTTTRPPRPGETDGEAYFFVGRAAFEEKIKEGHWVEWAKVHDHYYGTSAPFLEAEIAAGRDVLLDVDVQGARQIVEKYPDCVTIFIMPPSLERLRQRLESRQSDSRAVIERRLVTAEKEMAQRHFYRHIIVNDDLQEAVDRFLSVIDHYRT